MARIKDRERAVKLRKEGKTYSEIREITKVSKSTLSNWLQNYPLTSKQIRNLESNIKKRKLLAVEKTRNTKRVKSEKRLDMVYDNEKRHLAPLSKKELYLCGLFLYWGEGVKGLKTSLGLNNTDPRVVRFYLYWLIKSLGVRRKKIRVYVHLYKDMNVEKTLNFWSSELGISRQQFSKPYIKESRRTDLTHKGYGYGTCGLYVHDVRLKEKVILGLDAVADYYFVKMKRELI